MTATKNYIRRICARQYTQYCVCMHFDSALCKSLLMQFLERRQGQSETIIVTGESRRFPFTATPQPAGTIPYRNHNMWGTRGDQILYSLLDRRIVDAQCERRSSKACKQLPSRFVLKKQCHIPKLYINDTRSEIETHVKSIQ